ncbi:MAG: hypothetical protein KAQ98_11920 [Bacteriovoracaceae bacterium]|nr:hypothetical protein [Bacteriovoracaceae bacterium]
MKKMQEHLRRQESLNKATMQKSRAAAIEGAKQINQAQTSNIQEEEYRRQKKIESEGLRDTLERQQISNELQGLSPNSAGQQLKSTNFHSELAEKLGKAASMDAAKKQASRGFDTEGSYAGEIPVVRIKSRDTTPIPQERMTLQMQNLMKKREQVRINKNELEQKLEKMEKKTNLSPEDKVEIVKIKQEISTTHNKEIYYDFSIDEELKKPSNEVAPNKNE